MADTEEKFRALLAKGYKLADIRAFVQQRQAEQAAFSHTGPDQAAPGPWRGGYEGAHFVDANPPATPDKDRPAIDPDSAQGREIASNPWIPSEAKARMLNRPSDLDRAANNHIANTAGMLVGGGAGLALRAAAPLAGPLVRTAAAGIEATLAGGASGGATAAANGQPISPAVKEGGLGNVRIPGTDIDVPVPVVGMVLHSAGEAGGAGSRTLRRDPVIGRYANNMETGEYLKPQYDEMRPDGGVLGHRNIHGNAAVQKSAEAALDQVVQRDAQLGNEASTAYHGAVRPRLRDPVERGELVDTLRERQAGNINPDTGAPYSDAIHSQYEKAVTGTGSNPTVEGTLGRRRAIAEDAGFGSASRSRDERAAGTVYGAYRDAVRKAAPDVAAADDAYTAYANKAARRRDILFNTEDNVLVRGGGHDAVNLEHAPDELLGGKSHTLEADAAAAPEMRVRKQQSAATTLRRVGDTNEPGLRAQRYLDELAAQDPAFATALDHISNVKALEGTRFGFHSAIPSDLKGAVALGGKYPIIQQNARALGARLLDPGAALAFDVGNSAVPSVAAGSGEAAIIESRRREREREKARAERAKRGQ